MPNNKEIVNTIASFTRQAVEAQADLSDKIQENKNLIVDNARAIKKINAWKQEVSSSSNVTINVGPDRICKHPVDALEIVNNNVIGNVAYRIEVDPGIYTFPYKGQDGLSISGADKKVKIIGISRNTLDVVFQYIGNLQLPWLIQISNHATVRLKYLTLQGASKIDEPTVEKVATGNLDVLACRAISISYFSTLNISDCRIVDLWNGIQSSYNSILTVNRVTALRVCYGVEAQQHSHVQINHSTFKGISRSVSIPKKNNSSAIYSSCGSSIQATNVEIKDFCKGVLLQEKAFVKFEQGMIENIVYGVLVETGSSARVENVKINKASNDGISAIFSSLAHALYVTVDGASYGYLAANSSTIIASGTTAKNCTNYGYYSCHGSNVYAENTVRNCSNNTMNHPPSKDISNKFMTDDTGATLYYS